MLNGIVVALIALPNAAREAALLVEVLAEAWAERNQGGAGSDQRLVARMVVRDIVARLRRLPARPSVWSRAAP